jgi:hypothetical protein
MMECLPCNEIMVSVIWTFATPFASVFTFPRSPTWRMASLGPPWVFYSSKINKLSNFIQLNKIRLLLTPSGLKCDPVEVHPSRMSPLSWTWKPCGEFGDRFWRDPVIVTGSDAEFCVSINWPVTLLAVLPTLKTTTALIGPSWK